MTPPEQDRSDAAQAVIDAAYTVRALYQEHGREEVPRPGSPIARLLGALAALDAAPPDVARRPVSSGTEADALWRGMNEVRAAIEARTWLLEGRGSYEWNDDRYRQEAGIAMRVVLAIIERTQREASRLYRAALPDVARRPVAVEPTRAGGSIPGGGQGAPEPLVLRIAKAAASYCECEGDENGVDSLCASCQPFVDATGVHPRAYQPAAAPAPGPCADHASAPAAAALLAAQELALVVNDHLKFHREQRAAQGRDFRQSGFEAAAEPAIEKFRRALAAAPAPEPGRCTACADLPLPCLQSHAGRMLVLAAPEPVAGWWVIHFEDAERKHETFTTEASARAAFAFHKQNWNCVLFRQVEASPAVNYGDPNHAAPPSVPLVSGADALTPEREALMRRAIRNADEAGCTRTEWHTAWDVEDARMLLAEIDRLRAGGTDAALRAVLDGIGSTISAWIVHCTQDIEAEGEIIDPQIPEPFAGFVRAADAVLGKINAALGAAPAVGPDAPTDTEALLMEIGSLRAEVDYERQKARDLASIHSVITERQDAQLDRMYEAQRAGIYAAIAAPTPTGSDEALRALIENRAVTLDRMGKDAHDNGRHSDADRIAFAVGFLREILAAAPTVGTPADAAALRADGCPNCEEWESIGTRATTRMGQAITRADALRDALIEVRRVIEADEEAITDTIWQSESENVTLVDYIDSALGEQEH